MLVKAEAAVVQLADVVFSESQRALFACVVGGCQWEVDRTVRMMLFAFWVGA